MRAEREQGRVEGRRVDELHPIQTHDQRDREACLLAPDTPLEVKQLIRVGSFRARDDQRLDGRG
eukprot:1889551-Rhodomonas_salina.1